MSEYLKWGQLSTKKRPGRQRFFALSQASFARAFTCNVPLTVYLASHDDR
jgi:hypothetical protein